MIEETMMADTMMKATAEVEEVEEVEEEKTVTEVAEVAEVEEVEEVETTTMETLTSSSPCKITNFRKTTSSSFT